MKDDTNSIIDTTTKKDTKSIIQHKKKQINIIGKNNIDKFKKKQSKREVIKEYNLNEIYFTREKQLKCLHLFYFDIESSIHSIIQKEIKQKIQNYINQDKKNHFYDNQSFLSLDNILELLIISKLKCYYCRENIHLLYKNVREPFQWTLDRIDNTIGHNRENCVISCLKCNIQKKRMNDEKFRFSKQMKLIKKE